MRASGRILAVVLAGLSNLYLPGFAAAQQSDQLLAERVLGSQWKQLSRRAGMIFAGTVLNVAAPDASTNRASAGAPPAVELRFRVDQPIVGVESGQILTIHEWSGAWSMHRPMSNGQHILLFLYPRSELGLTSPVGGSLGQVVLDSSGTYGRRMSFPPAKLHSYGQIRKPLPRALPSFNWSGPSAAPGRSDHALTHFVYCH